MRTIWQAMLLACVLMIGACMRLGSDYQPPQSPVNLPEVYQHAPANRMQLPEPQDYWWRIFNDPAVDQLVQKVLECNLDIRTAVARMLEVRAQFRQTRAERWPAVNIEADMSSTRKSVTHPLSGVSAKTTTDTYSLALPAAFEWDLWGRLAHAQEAAQAELLAAQENRLTVAQTVVAEAISLYLQMISLERQIAVTDQSIADYQSSRDLVLRRFRGGLTSVLDLRQAERALARAEAELPALHQELGSVQQRLALIAGEYPKTIDPLQPPADHFQQLAPVPPGIPADLLIRRPDIRAAELRLRAQHARVGAAYANRFPRISLTAQFGYSSNELSELLSPNSELWSIATGVIQPLFDFGKLKAMHKQAQARLIQTQIDYARTVLNALAEVEKALLTREKQLLRRERILRFLKEARATQQIAQQRYERGLVEYFTVLEARQVRFQAELDLIRNEQAVYQSRVALHRALGGGWGDL